MTTVKRAFIAGAVCDHCGAQDRVQRCKRDGEDDYWMECVVCGWRMDMPSAPDISNSPTAKVNANLSKPLQEAPTLKPLETRK